MFMPKAKVQKLDNFDISPNKRIFVCHEDFIHKDEKKYYNEIWN